MLFAVGYVGMNIPLTFCLLRVTLGGVTSRSVRFFGRSVAVLFSRRQSPLKVRIEEKCEDT